MTDKTEAMDNLIAQDADLIETCSKDLVQRLRSNRPIITLPHEAADRIEALTAENEQLNKSAECLAETRRLAVKDVAELEAEISKWHTVTRAHLDRIETQAAEIERLREENLQLRSEMTMIELDSFDTYDDWCLRGLPEEAIGFADRTHRRNAPKLFC